MTTETETGYRCACTHLIAKHNPLGPCTECECKDYEQGGVTDSDIAAYLGEEKRRDRVVCTNVDAEGVSISQARGKKLPYGTSVYIGDADDEIHFRGKPSGDRTDAAYTACTAFYLSIATYVVAEGKARATCAGCLENTPPELIDQYPKELDSPAPSGREKVQRKDILKYDHLKSTNGFRYHIAAYDKASSSACGGMYWGDYWEMVRDNTQPVDCAKCKRWAISRGLRKHTQ